MTNSLIRRAVVRAGFVALFVSMVGKPVMADDDSDDDSDRKNRAPEIVAVQVTFWNGSDEGPCLSSDDTITIFGTNFSGRRIEPVVFLADEGPLTGCSSSRIT